MLDGCCVAYSLENRMVKRGLIALTGVLVAACGGGGGGGGTVSAPVANAVLTSNNAMVVAGTTTDGALFSAEFDELANLGILGSPGGVAVVQSAGDASMTLAKQTASLQAATAEVSVGPETEDCLFGGTLTISANIQNPEMLSAGDTFSMNYASCDFGEGMVANGSIGFTVTSFQGDLVGDDFSVGFDLTIDSFMMTEAGENVSLDGDFSMSMTIAATSSIISMSGSSLSVNSGSEFYELSEFSTTTTVDLSMFPESFSLQSSGFLMTSEFDGQVQFSTTVAFQGSGEGNPVSGEFLITGASGATIRVIPLDEQTVRLELDLDGDNAVDPDGVIDVTWQEFLNTPA